MTNTRAAKRKKKRFYLVLTSLTILALAVGLVLTALQDSISLFLDPTELKARNLPEGERVRLGGLVATDSFIKDDDGLTYHFDITDGLETVSVTYKGSLPDLLVSHSVDHANHTHFRPSHVRLRYTSILQYLPPTLKF